MYLCFESDEKRSAFPESSLISFDENGFLFTTINSKGHQSSLFLRLETFQGCMQAFPQALSWIKRAQPQRKA